MIKLTILKFLQWLIFILDQILGFFIGYTFSRGWKNDYIKSTTHYEFSAQRFNIAFRAKATEFEAATPLSFLLFHSDYVHPNCVCRHDNISLMGLTQDQAFFVVVPNNINIYDSNVHPFLYASQFKFATQLIVMPIKSFHQLANEIGDPLTQVVLVSSTGRCGSTLLAQIFENVPKTLVMSEPDAFLQASGFYCTRTSDDDEEEMLQSITRLQCKAQHTREIDRIVIKTRSQCIRQVKKIRNKCSYVKHIYMYRQPKETIMSFVKIFMSSILTPPIGVIKELFLGKDAFKALIPDLEKYNSKSSISTSLVERLSIAGIMALMWILNSSCYIEYKQLGIEIYPLKYELLLQNPESVTTTLFQSLGISNKHVGDGLKALEKDSQRGSNISRNALSGNMSLTEEQRIEIEELFYKAGFDSFDNFKDLPDQRKLKVAETFLAV